VTDSDPLILRQIYATASMQLLLSATLPESCIRW